MERERRSAGRALAWTVAAVPAAAALITVQPRWLGLSGLAGPAQLVALRGLTALLLAALAIVLAAVVAVLRRSRRWAALPALLAAAVVAVSAGTHAGVVLARSGEPAGAGSGAAALTVLSLNTERGNVRPEEIVRLVLRTDAEVVALPETGEAQGARVAAALAGAGRPAQRFTMQNSDDESSAVTLLVDRALGDYRSAEVPFVSLGSVAAGPVDGRGPRLVAVHTAPPIPVLVGMDRWAQDVRSATSTCIGEGAVVAGDFNATVDHAAFALPSGCLDAGSRTGTTGTWPSRLAPVLGAAIDHVLVDEGAWEPRGSEVVDAGDSDHRALVVHLAQR